MMFRRTRAYPPEIRARARELRRAGLTYPEIVAELGANIPQATLSHWVRDIELTTEQKARIKQKELEGSAKGRPFAILWNRSQSKRVSSKRSNWQPRSQNDLRVTEKLFN